MAYKIISHTDYQITNLNDVDTIQIFIYPEEANFSKQDFQLRISSAKMYQQITEFTSLPGFQRKLILLFGRTTLEHRAENTSRSKELLPYDSDCFSGDQQTVNYGISEDFNLIYRNDFTPEPKLSILKHKQTISLSLQKNQFALIYSVEHLIEIDIQPENDYLADSIVLKEQDSLLITNETADFLIQDIMPGSVKGESIAILCLFELPDNND